MVEEFQNSLFQIISKSDKVLLAVSGGMDSTLLCHLFAKSGVEFAMAHCNFHLRGEESDGDENFVKALAASLGVPFFVKHFDTKEMLKTEKGSIQMLARDLRYEWLEEIRTEEGFQYIATAHHLNDSIETAIYNFSKGTGIRGLRGILPKSNKIIRPFLHFSRNEIEVASLDLKMNHREDSSNADDKYARNKIRHHIVPILKKLNPSLEKTMLGNFERLGELEEFMDYFIGQIKNEIIENKNGQIFIDKKLLNKYTFKKTILYEILKKYDFNVSQIDDLISFMDGISGKQIFSETHRLVNDRKHLIIDELFEKEIEIHWIEKGVSEFDIGEGKLVFRVLNQVESYSKNKSLAYFDMDKLEFPLKLRRWKDGDYFYPIGMDGKSKKVKKLFTDLKLSLPEKEQKWILESNGKICWILGIRMDERFKINEKTKQILEVLICWGPNKFN